MNKMFIFQSKRLFAQGSILQFWRILVSYGEKIGYIGVPLPLLAGPDRSRIRTWNVRKDTKRDSSTKNVSTLRDKAEWRVRILLR